MGNPCKALKPLAIAPVVFGTKGAVTFLRKCQQRLGSTNKVMKVVHSHTKQA